jgi:hypothetical protein
MKLMTATIKSRVLVREEKGMGSVSMKRLVFCGMGAGIAYLILNVSPLSVCSIPALFVAFVSLIYLSGNRYGIARYQWLLLTARGRLLLNAYRVPDSWSARLCELLNLNVRITVIHGVDLFAGGNSALMPDDMAGIEILQTDVATGGYEILSDEDVLEVL